ncbi:MAG: hypothetical protein M3Y87_32185 [Myxococcota bacterium]|nr:hypothetical protein [Myxococcota bacterium]
MRHLALLLFVLVVLASPAAAQAPGHAPAHASFIVPDVWRSRTRFFYNLDVEREGAAWLMTGCRSGRGSCRASFHRVLTADEGRTYEAHWREMGASATCQWPALGRMEDLLTVDYGSAHLGRPFPTDAPRRAALVSRIGGLGRGGDCDSSARLALFLVTLAPSS